MIEGFTFAGVGGFPINCRTVTCCAESNIPRIERTRLEYQNADASQYASATAFQEKEPIAAAARIALYNESVNCIEFNCEAWRR